MVNTTISKYVFISDLSSGLREKRSAGYSFGGGYDFGWKRSLTDFDGFNFNLSDIEVREIKTAEITTSSISEFQFHQYIQIRLIMQILHFTFKSLRYYPYNTYLQSAAAARRSGEAGRRRESNDRARGQCRTLEVVEKDGEARYGRVGIL